MVRQHISKKNGVLKLFSALFAIGVVISVEFVTIQPDVEFVPVRNIQSWTVSTKVSVLTVKVIIQPLQKLPCLSTNVSATEIQSFVLIPLKTIQT